MAAYLFSVFDHMLSAEKLPVIAENSLSNTKAVLPVTEIAFSLSSNKMEYLGTIIPQKAL
jgi:hypothetical protein